jgi:NAD(P)-dependent dehydrogenase (short-subunit alcohol dehydrogenase family)
MVGNVPLVASALVIGNSDGIGKTLTELLLAEGWHVTGISRRSGCMESDQHYSHHILDVCSPDYRQQLSKIVADLGVFKVCVYCVGIGDMIDTQTLASDRLVFETNLVGAVVTAQVVLPVLVHQGSGHLIGLSSQADELVNGDAPSYSASKAGLSSYLESLAIAYRPHGIHITNLRFGFVDTKMAKSPVRPFMVSREQAAQRILYCIRKKPIRDTYPKRMALLLWFLKLGQRVKRIFI